MDRRQLFEAQDEEDLLRLQNEFLSKSQPGAAKVKRIGRPADAGAGASQPAPTPPPPEPSKPAGIQDVALSSIMGDVLERATPADAATVVPPQLGSADTPFPVATHRKQSKFAMARKAAVAGTAAVPSATPHHQALPDVSGGAAVVSNIIQERTASTQAGSAAQAVAAAAAAAAAALPPAATAANISGTSLSGGLPETMGIDAQNRSVLTAMAPQEVAEALDEIKSRISPKTLEFLRKRGAARAGGAGAAAAAGTLATEAAGGTAARGVAAPSPTTAVAPFTSHYTCLASGEQAAGARGTSGQAAVRPATSGKQQAAQGTQQQAAAQQPGAALLPQHNVAGLDGEGRLRADPRLVARLRWGLDAQVVGVQAQGEVQAVEDVLKRDALRADAGAVPDGYTPTELLLLARSALPAHRAAGLAMLRALLLAARPAPSRTQNAQQPLIPIPHELLQPLKPTTGDSNQTPAMGVSQPAVGWSQLWSYLVTELGVASHLRLALDDAHAQVVGAAAAALAALVCPGPEEAVALEVADACPRLGWPAVRLQSLVRPHAAGTWEVQGVEAGDTKPGDLPPLSTLGQGGPGGEGEDATPEDVALVDPLAGLLQMQLVPRLRYLLDVAGLQGAAAAAALQLLAACARHSDAAAMAVVKCPGLLAALKARLLPGTAQTAPPTHQTPDGHPADTTSSTSNDAADSAQGASSAAAAPGTSGGLQVLVLHVLRLLCQSSALAAQLVRSSGVLAAVQGQLVVGCTAAAAALQDGGSPEAGLVVIEGLRLWRVCAAQGVGPFTYEDMHTLLCGLMTPPAAAAAAADTPERTNSSSSDAGSSGWYAHLHWHVAREATLLVDRLLVHALDVAKGDKTLGRAMLQPGTAAALAQEVGRLWLCPGVVRLAAEAGVSRPDAALRVAGVQQWMEWTAAGVHPSLLLPRAFAVHSCLAAALQLVATYWGGVDPGLHVFGEVRGALARSGLLGDNSSSGSDSSSSASETPQQPRQQQEQQQAECLPGNIGASHALAAALLRAPAAAHADSAAIGAAFTAQCMEVVTAPVTQPPSAPSAAPHGQASLNFMQLTCTHVAAAEFLLGTMRLTLALSRNPHTPETVPAAVAAPPEDAHSSALTLPGLAAQAARLVHGLQHALPAGLVADAGGSSLTKVLGPWGLVRLQLGQPRARLFLAACRAASLLPLPGAASQAEVAAASGQLGAAGGASARDAVAVIDGCLSILPLSPPGAEAQCLAALQHACTPARLTPVLQQAQTAVAALESACPRLHAAASGLRGGASSSLTAPPPYPPPQQALDAASAGAALMHGYAASWLSMVAADDGPGSSGSSSGSSGAAAGGGPLPLDPAYPAPCLPDPSGSRLPAPHTWLLAEVLELPQHTSRKPAAATRNAPAGGDQQQHRVHPVAAALALGCGLEGLGSAYLGAAVAGGAGAKLAAALALAYVHDSHELMRGEAGAGGSRRGARLQGVREDVADGEDGVRGGAWWEPGVRWPLACLTHSYGCSRDGDESKQGSSGAVGGSSLAGGSTAAPHAWLLRGGWCGAQLVEKLASQFGAVSYGDPLLGCQLATLLAAGVPGSVQRALWGALVEDQALHLLPPLSACLGLPQQYTGAGSCTAGGGGASVTRDASMTALFTRSLTNGELDKALAVGAVSVEVAVAVLVAHMCGSSSTTTTTSTADSAIDAQAAQGISPTGQAEGAQGAMSSNSTAADPAAGEGHSGGNTPSASASQQGAATARALVSGLQPQVLAAVVGVAERQGCRREDVGRALVHACRGDLALMDKLKWVLAQH